MAWNEALGTPQAKSAPARRPRLGFLGTGWIGRHRMLRVAESGFAEVAAIADTSAEMLSEAHRAATSAQLARNLEELLSSGLDGIVIATPSALHAEQSIQALERGHAVFCQKPLGRSTREVRSVIEAARRANRLLDVDLSYRHTEAVQRIRGVMGEIGDVYAVDLAFHNAYGPDKPWFYDRELSGGGCVMDLGVHLVDLALWMLDFPRVENVSSRLYAQGRLLPSRPREVEDYAVARLDLAGGASVQIACSWRLPAGSDAVISATFYGTQGGLSMQNVNGSFYDFAAYRFCGTAREQLCAPPDAWGGRAAVHWARRLAEGARFDPSVERLIQVQDALDAVYGR